MPGCRTADIASSRSRQVPGMAGSNPLISLGPGSAVNGTTAGAVNGRTAEPSPVPIRNETKHRSRQPNPMQKDRAFPSAPIVVHGRTRYRKIGGMTLWNERQR
jgi:hypothetical protein